MRSLSLAEPEVRTHLRGRGRADGPAATAGAGCAASGAPGGGPTSSAAYLRKLPAAIERGEPGATPSVPMRPDEPAQHLAEPLSGRELEVLTPIAAGPNKQIAQELVVTVGTIKTHINNIYGKLDVGSRTQAVARAREIDIL